MAKASRPEPAVGQLWKVSGITYRIDTMTGPDACYPIVLREVERDPSVDRELRARMAAEEGHRRAFTETLLEPRVMWQEALWFELRTDVAQYVGEAS